MPQMFNELLIRVRHPEAEQWAKTPGRRHLFLGRERRKGGEEGKKKRRKEGEPSYPLSVVN